MSDILAHLKPENVFGYFEEITKIPHGSGDTKRLSDYCANVIRNAGLSCQQDEMGNLIAVKEAAKGYENVPTVMLQGHLDMVNEKTTESNHDFTLDSLELKTEGDWIFAKDTTLGGDDGIAVAYMLAILSDPDLKHPRLECVFTVDEEVGLLGANGLDVSSCRAQYLINLDNEEEGIFISSCAGGVRVDQILPIQRMETEGKQYEIQMDHLKGGHSGSEIHKGHANANILMGRLLYELGLKEDEGFGLISCDGGQKDNAISRSCTAKVVTETDYETFSKNVLEVFEGIRKEYRHTEPDMEVKVVPVGEGNVWSMTPSSQMKVIFLLRMNPNGVQAMSHTMKGLVETSLNLGIMKTTEEEFTVCFSVRSSVESAKLDLVNRLTLLIEFLGGEAYLHGDYPGWEYQPQSRLREKMVQTWKDLFHEEAKVEAIHAGLECGLLLGKMPWLDAVSIGPNMEGVHTPKERLSISSTRKCYEFLIRLLEEIRE